MNPVLCYLQQRENEPKKNMNLSVLRSRKLILLCNVVFIHFDQSYTCYEIFKFLMQMFAN